MLNDLGISNLEFIKSQLGMLAMALHMEKYCKVLEMNGATFYEDPMHCEYLKDIF